MNSVRVWNLAALGCAALVLAATVAGCGSSSTTSATQAKSATSTQTTTPGTTTNPNLFGEISLTSAAFKNGHPIPVTYTCAGADISPPLQWRKIPAGAAELVLVALDIGKTGRNKIVWAVGGIQPTDAQVAAGAIPAGAVAGVSDSGKAGWGGVCDTKKGERHRIAFLIYAVKSKLHLKSGFSPLAMRQELRAATISTGLTIASYKPA